MRRPPLSLLACCWLLLAAACATGPQPVHLTHYLLAEPHSRFDESIALLRTADDLREDSSGIGHTTGTLFSIPLETVVTDSPLREEIGRQVSEALGTLGYNVIQVDTLGDLEAPLASLALSIQEFRFNNFTWAAPIIHTSGKIVLGVVVRDPGGRVRYEQSFSGGGSSVCSDIDCGFAEATTRAMTEVLDGIVTAGATESFRSAFVAQPDARPPLAP